jgi:mRNA interferase HicA
VKRKDLMKQLGQQAKSEGLELEVVEGGNHTKVMIGDRRSTVPRHKELNELTAKAILRQMGVER